MSLIQSDNSDNLDKIDAFLVGKGLKKSDLNSRILIKHISSLVAIRSAGFFAAAIAATVLWIDPQLEKKHVIGIDGSVYEKYPGYKDMVEKTLTDLLGEKSRNIVCDFAEDGSGIGAAIIAAVVTSSRD